MIDSTNPFLPQPIYVQQRTGTKIATPDIFLDTESFSINTMSEYTFATVGGIELLSSSRYDLIDSPLNNEYTPIIDAGTRFYSTKEIVVVDGSSETFTSYSIDMNNHIVNDVANTVDKIKIDGVTQYYVIQLKNLKPEYRVEVQILSETDIDHVTI